MNDLFFACDYTKKYIDASYRWAASLLVSQGHVVTGEKIKVEAVLNQEEYWNPPKNSQSKWLLELLPNVRSFLIEHREYSIRFGDSSALFGNDYAFDWLDLSPAPDLSPRYFIEVLQIYTWENVIAYAKNMQSKPWWFYDNLSNAHPAVSECFCEAKDTFERLINAIKRN